MMATAIVVESFVKDFIILIDKKTDANNCKICDKVHTKTGDYKHVESNNGLL